MTVIGTMRALDGTRGAVRVEDVYDTGIADLWEACTTPEGLERWITSRSTVQVGRRTSRTSVARWPSTARRTPTAGPRRGSPVVACLLERADAGVPGHGARLSDPATIWPADAYQVI